MALRRRKVVGSERVPSNLRYPLYLLQLECGHQTSRRDRRRRGPPLTVECDQCEIALDRLSYVEAPGWTTSRAVAEKHATLIFLEREGLVESSRQPHTGTVYWRLKPGAKR